MSFFDEGPETRRARPPRQRRSAPSRGGSATDQQTVMVRRGVALGGGIVIFLLLLVAVNACRGSARENALKDYNRSVASISRESETQVGRPFFALLSGQSDSGSPTDLQTSVSSLREEAQAELDQAQELDVPDDMVPAHRSLLIALELRRDGLDVIAQRVRQALGDQSDAAEEATNQIAGQMQAFLASDVLYRTRVRPLIRTALEDAEIGGQDTPDSRFVPNIAWLSPTIVADRLGGAGAAADGDAADSDAIAPGTHGTGLESVAVGDTTLQPGASNRVTATGAPTFTVRFTNQGENDEEDVRVDVSVKGASGGAAITGSDTVDTVARGATATAEVRLPRAPASGSALTVTVRVRAVPGEKMTDNNEQTYPVLFSGG